MNSKQLVSSILIAATAASAYPMTAEASATYDMRERVVELTGILNPTDGSRYISRGEFATMLVKASEYRSTVSNVNAVSVFADVPVDSSYAPYIRIAARQGWMKGYLGGQFRPEEYVTLQDAAWAFLAILGYTNDDFTGDQNGSRIAMFNYLELNEELGNLGASEILTEDNCINLFYNLLKTEPKDSSTIYGSIFDLTLSSDDEISPLEMLDTTVKGPYLVNKRNTMSSQLPFDMDEASFFLDGEAVSRSSIRSIQDEYGYLVMYYNATSKTVWIYTEEGSDTTGNRVISGEVTNIYYTSSDVMTPTSITITGDDGETYECELTTSDLQFAFSIYGTVEVGDDVIVVCSGSTESEDGDTTYRVTDFLED